MLIRVLTWIYEIVFFRYASRVRTIVNDPSKHVSSKEMVRLKKLVAYWKEQAGKRNEEEDLVDIEEDRTLRDGGDSLIKLT